MISVFDMFKIGIGPSSSHTVGPMRAAKAFIQDLKDQDLFERSDYIKTELYGSLGQTGKGHGTGKAIMLGLLGHDPETVDVEAVDQMLAEIDKTEKLNLNGEKLVAFPKEGAIVFHRRKTLKLHANGLTLFAYQGEELLFSQTYYSIGGGFIIKEEDFDDEKATALKHEEQPVPYPFEKAADLLKHCKEHGMRISSLMLKNEQVFQSEKAVRTKLWHIWQVMRECVDKGIQKEGILPGGLKVSRRAPGLYRKLQNEKSQDPMAAMDWVNLFALAVNEENAAGSRVVTAPTNGAAGIIPAVLCYFDKFVRPVDEDTATRYLLTAAAIGILYKKNASISGAEVGCQGEVGVACSMAAGALAEIMGGSVDGVENAAEIGMEHNLGLTCDPVGGLVQVPCIERNAMGAVKAINAARLALRGTGEHKVSLDKVIKTMWDTGNDMKSKYKETARGGLAVNIIEC
ncbi:L-serine ammonia-lyase [Aliiglaciecola sp. CAU 1673]|uniref:L-serine ammonia-lyase n=1 Tax=Aliiglaciecola sp. CAU 1673 TaxID=3032595 RepID=UPI0023DCB90A|nr:L-serine ammonia-lyase [Aliiglaciecola sp. CAU 1673]MDF2178890.1 L-serine ammonia-lyase [Aliiglaciecola sp. CAU 1673]